MRKIVVFILMMLSVSALVHSQQQTKIMRPNGVIADFPQDTLSTANSTTALLGSSSTFTGSFVSTEGYANTTVMVLSDQLGAAGGIKVQHSSDGTNIDYVSSRTLDSTNEGRVITVPTRGKYVRVLYTNGTTTQGTFRLQTYQRVMPSSAAITELDLPLSSHLQALVTKSEIVGKTTAGGSSYVDVKVNPSGALTVEATITSGTVTAYSIPTNSVGAQVQIGPREQTPAGNAMQVQIGPGDIVSNLPVFMDYEHHQRHEGETWAAEYYLTTGVSTTQFALETPTCSTAANCPHFVMSAVIYEGNAELRIYEGATYTGGTQMTFFNEERNILTSPTVTLVSGITSTTGTKLPHTLFLSGGVRSAGSARGENEIVMKSATTYRIDFEEIGNVSRAVIRFVYYLDLGV